MSSQLSSRQSTGTPAAGSCSPWGGGDLGQCCLNGPWAESRQPSPSSQQRTPIFSTDLSQRQGATSPAPLSILVLLKCSSHTPFLFARRLSVPGMHALVPLPPPPRLMNSPQGPPRHLILEVKCHTGDKPLSPPEPFWLALAQCACGQDQTGRAEGNAGRTSSCEKLPAPCSRVKAPANWGGCQAYLLLT